MIKNECNGENRGSSGLILTKMKNHFFMSFSMLEKMIDHCPDDLWNVKAGGFVFWQQIIHALTGSKFWMRKPGSAFEEPFAERNVYPELEQDPEGLVSKDEMREYMDHVKLLCIEFFDGKDDEWLLSPAGIYDKITNLDIVLMQIRHLQYHVGHCNSILRDRNLEAVDWIDMFE
ncbi:MAG: DinB family protein [Eubacteriales bacterium]|jgi:hypothetical protein